VTMREAFDAWYAAYSKNYGSTGLMDSRTISEQSWAAALNYAETRMPPPQIRVSVERKEKLRHAIKLLLELRYDEQDESASETLTDFIVGLMEMAVKR
jgi:hypothetical protein